jgi:hypothetical protein
VASEYFFIAFAISKHSGSVVEATEIPIIDGFNFSIVFLILSRS